MGGLGLDTYTPSGRKVAAGGVAAGEVAAWASQLHGRPWHTGDSGQVPGLALLCSRALNAPPAPAPHCPTAAPGAKRQQSPLLIAGVLGGAAVVGGLLLFDVAEVGEQALQVAPSASGLTAGIDDNTKALLQVGGGEGRLVGALVGGALMW